MLDKNLAGPVSQHNREEEYPAFDLSDADIATYAELWHGRKVAKWPPRFISWSAQYCCLSVIGVRMGGAFVVQVIAAREADRVRKIAVVGVPGLRSAWQGDFAHPTAVAVHESAVGTVSG